MKVNGQQLGSMVNTSRLGGSVPPRHTHLSQTHIYKCPKELFGEAQRVTNKKGRNAVGT